MSDNQKKLCGIALIQSFFFSVVCAVLMTVALFARENDGFYMSGGAFSVLRILLAASLVSSFALLFPCRRSVCVTTRPPLYLRIICMITCIGTLCFSGYYWSVCVTYFSASDFRLGFTSLLTAVFTLFGAGFFLLKILQLSHPDLEALCGMSLLLAALFFALYIYFDTSAPRNATIKLFLSVAVLLVALFLLSDTRLSLGKPRWFLYHLSALAAAPVAASVSVAGIIYRISNGAAPFASLHPYILLLVFFIYIYGRELWILQLIPKCLRNRSGSGAKTTQETGMDVLPDNHDNGGNTI